MKEVKFLSCLFCFLTFYIELSAQKWVSHTNSDDIRAISIDSKGNEWFATTGGLKKFDGVNWTKYTNTNSGLHLTKLTSVAVDKQDRVWAGTLDGISVFDGTNWITYTYENTGLYLKDIVSIQVDQNGNVCVATDGGGFFIYANSSWQVYTTGNSSIPCDAFQQLYIFEGKYYLASRCGLVIFDGTNWESYNTSNSPIGQDHILSVTVDRSGKIYCGSYNQGLFVKDGSNWLHFNSDNSPINSPNVNINSVMADSINGLLWVGHSGNTGVFLDTLNQNGVWGTFVVPQKFKIFPGVMALGGNSVKKNVLIGTTHGIVSFKDKNRTDFIATINDLSHNTGGAIKSDSLGNVWFGNFVGLSNFNGFIWTEYNQTNSPINGVVDGILIDENNHKWFSNGNGPLYKYDGQNWTSFDIPRAYNSVTDKNGTKWFVVLQDGFAKLQADVITRYNTIPPLVNGYVTGLDLDKSGNLWISTLGGAQRFDGTNWFTYTTANSGLQINSINDVLVDRSGNVWFGCTGAVTRFDGTNWTSWYADGLSGLAGDYIFDVEEDIDGTIWVGGTGISKFDGTKWFSYTTKNSGLVGDYIRRISIDRDGNKWIASGDAGVSFFNDKPTPAAPIVTIEGPNQICNGDYVLLKSSEPTGNQWYRDGFPITTNGNGQTYFANSSGIYTVKVTLNGLESLGSIPKTVILLPKPQPAFTVNTASQVLTNNSFVFTNTSTGGSTYLWRFGNGATATIQNATYSYTAAGSYVVRLIVTTAAGCKDSTSSTVTVTAPPPPPPVVPGNLFAQGTTCAQFNGNTGTALTRLCYTVSKGKVSSVTPASFMYYVRVTAPSASFTVNIAQTVSRSGFRLFTVNTGGSVATGDNCARVTSVSSPSTGQARVSITKATVGRTYIIGVRYDTKSLVEYATTGTLNASYGFSAKIGNTTTPNSTGSVMLYPNNCVGVSGGQVTARLPEMGGLPGAAAGVDKTGSDGKLQIRVYPNPSNSRFTVLIESSDRITKGTLRIINAQGQVIEEIKEVLPGAELQMGMKYVSGTYTAVFIQGNQTTRQRMVKY